MLDKRNVELFKWCPSCDKEEVAFVKEPEVVYMGMDVLGHGQPVRYSECECGKTYGWLWTAYYNEELRHDAFFLSYLKHRISFYYRD